ncbi:MAG: sigma-70 family RNA polymerase sigma factor [Candidatus Omnitrophota bacterium]
MDDLEFARNCIRGDKYYCNEFVDKYSRLIYNYIGCVLQQKNPHLFTLENIKDIFQGIFLSLFKDGFNKLKTFKAKNGCSLASWLRQVTVNYTLDYVRKFRSVVSLDEEDNNLLSLKDIIADNRPSVKENLNNEERLSQLEECVKRLDIDEKYFMEFHIHRGLSLEVMKKMLGASRGAVDMRKKRIVGKLKECFKRKGFIIK